MDRNENKVPFWHVAQDLKCTLNRHVRTEIDSQVQTL